MESKENSGKAKVAGAFILGAVVGAALGVLLAPDKGSETRKRIFGDAADPLSDLAERMFGEKVNRDPDDERPA